MGTRLIYSYQYKKPVRHKKQGIWKSHVARSEKEANAVIWTYWLDGIHPNAEKLTGKTKFPKCSLNLQVRHFTSSVRSTLKSCLLSEQKSLRNPVKNCWDHPRDWLPFMRRSSKKWLTSPYSRYMWCLAFHKHVMDHLASKQHLVVIKLLKRDDQIVWGLTVLPAEGKARHYSTQGDTIKNTEITFSTYESCCS